MKTIRIKGFQGTSLLDFPGRVASLVFTGGCNLTCPFCHNGGLILAPDDYPDFPLEELLADLKKRQGFVDGVVVSGGEPTIDAGLPAFLSQLKELGFKVKIDSNGLVPEMIGRLLEDSLVDYFAIDIKTAPNRYHELHTRPVKVADLQRTVNLLLQASVDVEFRTTCIPGLVGEQEITEMGELIEGADDWVLQQYVAGHAMAQSWQEIDPYPAECLEAFADQAKRYVRRVELRGI